MLNMLTSSQTPKKVELSLNTYNRAWMSAGKNQKYGYLFIKLEETGVLSNPQFSHIVSNIIFFYVIFWEYTYPQNLIYFSLISLMLPLLSLSKFNNG